MKDKEENVLPNKNEDCFVNFGYKERKIRLEKEKKLKPVRCECLGKDKIICKPCALKCHSNHKYEEIKDYLPVMFVCECALRNHETEEESDKKLKYDDIDFNTIFVPNKEDYSNLYCNLICLSRDGLKYKYYFENESKDKKHCIFHYSLLTNKEGNFNKIKILPDEEIICTNPKQKDVFDFFEKSAENLKFNKDRIFFNIMTNQEFISLFKPIQQRNERMFSHNKNLEKIEIDDYYKFSAKFFKNFCIGILKETFVIEDKDIYFIKDTIRILKGIANIETKDESLLIYLYYSLYMFRKFKIYPFLGTSLFKFSGFKENMNPYQRILFTIDPKEKVNELEEIYQTIQALFPLILDFVCEKKNFFESDYNLKHGVNKISWNHLIVYEYMKISKIILHFNISPEKIKLNISNLLKIASKYSSSMDFDNMTQIRILKIVYYHLLKLKDLELIEAINKKNIQDNKEIDNYIEEIKAMISKDMYYKSETIDDQNFVLKNLFYFNTFYNESLINFSNSSNFNRYLQLFQSFTTDHYSRKKNIHDLLLKVNTSKERIYIAMKNFSFEKIKFSNFNQEIITILEELKGEIKNFDDNGELSTELQYLICESGFFSRLIEIINFYNTNLYIIHKNESNKYNKDLLFHNKILEILHLLTKNNILISSLFFNTNFYRIFLFFGKPIKLDNVDKQENEFYTNYYRKILNFYLDLLEIVNKQGLKIDLVNFVISLKCCPDHKNFDRDNSIMEMYLTLYHHSVEVNLHRSLQRMYQLLIEEIKNKSVIKKYKQFVNAIKPKQEGEENQEEGKNDQEVEIIEEGQKMFYINLFKLVFYISNHFSIIENFRITFNSSSILEFVMSFNDEDEIKITPDIKRVYFLYFCKYYFQLLPHNKIDFRYVDNYNDDGTENVEEDNLQTYDSNKDLQIVFEDQELKIIDLLLKLMQSYPKIYNSDYFKEDLLNNIPFFIDCIYKTTLRIVYKFLYIKDLNKKGKLFFRLIYLFYKCLRYFCIETREILIRRMNESENNKIKNLTFINKYFVGILTEEECLDVMAKKEIQIQIEIDKILHQEFNYSNFNSIVKTFRNITNFIFHFDRKSISVLNTMKQNNKLVSIYNFIQQSNDGHLEEKNFDPNCKIYEYFENMSSKKCIQMFAYEIKRSKEQLSLFMLRKCYFFVQRLKKEGKENPDNLQDLILKFNKKEDFFDFCVLILKNLPNIILIEYNSLNRDQKICYTFYLDFLELMRLLCENHNQIFQTIYLQGFKSKKKHNNTCFDLVCNFWISITETLQLIKERGFLISIFKNTELNVNAMIKMFSDFIIEIIQGTFKMNFRNFVNNNNRTVYLKEVSKLFVTIGREQDKNNIIEYSILNFLKIFYNYYTEKNQLNFWEVFGNIVTSKIMLKWLIYFYKKLYALFINKNENVDIDAMQLPSDSWKILLDRYKLNEDIYQHTYFEICSLIYSFLLMIPEKVKESDDKMDKFEEDFRVFFSEIQEKAKSDSKEFSIRAEIAKFLDSTHKTVEIQYENFVSFKKENFHKNEKNLRDILIEKIHLLMKYELSPSDNLKKSIIGENNKEQVKTNNIEEEVKKTEQIIKTEEIIRTDEEEKKGNEVIKQSEENENDNKDEENKSNIDKENDDEDEEEEDEDDEDDEESEDDEDEEENSYKENENEDKSKTEELEKEDTDITITENELNKYVKKDESKRLNIVVKKHPISLFSNKLDWVKLFAKAPYDMYYERWNYILKKQVNLEAKFTLRNYLLNESAVMYELNNLNSVSVLKTTSILSLITNMFFIYPFKNDYVNNIGEMIILIHSYYLFYVILLGLYNHILKKQINRNVEVDVQEETNNLENEESKNEKDDKDDEDDESSKLFLFWKTLKFFNKEEMFPISLNFIFCLLAIYFPTISNLFYAFQLISIFFLFPVMSNVISAVNKRYLEFFYTTILIIILTLFYSSISFYYFRDDYFSSDLNENVCDSYLACFLHIFNYGIRTGGIGDFSGIKPFDHPQFFSHFVFSWMFYFTIILIMLNVFNGIIVDAFQTIRIEKEKRDNFSKNVCFICEEERSNLEKIGNSFSTHTDKTHNISHYIHYFIRIKKSDKFDLNSLESWIRSNLDSRQPLFFYHKEKN